MKEKQNDQENYYLDTLKRKLYCHNELKKEHQNDLPSWGAGCGEGISVS